MSRGDVPRKSAKSRCEVGWRTRQRSRRVHRRRNTPPRFRSPCCGFSPLAGKCVDRARRTPVDPTTRGLRSRTRRRARSPRTSVGGLAVELDRPADRAIGHSLGTHQASRSSLRAAAVLEFDHHAERIAGEEQDPRRRDVLRLSREPSRLDRHLDGSSTFAPVGSAALAGFGAFHGLGGSTRRAHGPCACGGAARRPLRSPPLARLTVGCHRSRGGHV